MKKLFIIFMLILFNINIAKANQVLADKIVATVNGRPITLYELKNIAGFYRVSSVKELLNKVIDDYLIEEYAQNVGVTVSDSDVDAYIDNLAMKNNMTTEDFINKIKESGIDLDYYKRGIKLILYRYKFERRVFLPSIKISDSEVANYYKLHKDQFKNAGKVAVLSIITLRDLKTAQKVYKKLQEGGDFYKLQEEYSLNKDKERKVPISVLNPYLQNKILSLKDGEFTNIIEAAGKFYIVKLIKIEESGDVKNQIRDVLISQRIKAKLNSWLKMIRSRSNIEIFLKNET